MIRLDGHALKLLFTIEEERQELGIDRINSVLFLKVLLEMEECPIWEAILKQIESYVFPEILDECDMLVKREARSKKSKDAQRKKQQRVKQPEEETEEAKQVNSEETAKQDEEKIIYPTVTIKTSQGDYNFILDFDMYNVIELINTAEGEIDIYDLTAAFVYIMPKKALNVLRTFGVNIQSLRKDYLNNKILFDSQAEVKEEKTVNIPSELKSFLTNLNDKLSNENCDISGRVKECKLVWQTLQKQTKRNVILIGKPGVGKTSIVEKITFDILSGNCPEEFKNMQVFSLDVNASIAGTMYRGQAEERYAKLTAFLEVTPNVILFIDEIHLIRGAGACREGEADLANAIKPILAGGKVRVIGATTSEEYEKILSQDGAIKRRFRTIEVKEPTSSEVYPMLKKTIESLSNFHGVSISREMVDFIILNAACFNNETKNPDRTKDLIDLSMVAAKRDGKKEVDKISVLSNFNYNFEMFVKMPEEYKKSVAYHEAGHCILFKCSKYMKQHRVIAVTIIPGESYLGKNVTETDDQFLENPTEAYYIDLIASYLAGRVSESLFTGSFNAGACGDLESATKIAHQVVSLFGMAKYGQNRMFFDEVNSQKVQDKVNDEIDDLIQKGFDRAKQVIEDNKDKLEALVKLLMNKGIVGPKELAKIFHEEQQEQQEQKKQQEKPQLAYN